MTRFSSRLALAAVAASTVLAGCSNPDDAGGPEEVAVEWAHAVADGDDEAACELAARISADPDTVGQFADSWEDWDAELREDCTETYLPSTLPQEALSDDQREDLAALTVDDVEVLRVLDEPYEAVTTFRLGDIGISVDVVEHDGRGYAVWSRPALSTPS